MRTRNKVNMAATLVAVVMCLAATVEAAEIFMSAVIDNWDNPAAWEGGVVPGASDMAVVEGTGYRTIRITNGIAAVAERLTLAKTSNAARTGYCEMSGGSLTLSGHLLMASASSAHRAYFTLSDGTANIAAGRIGQSGRGVFTQTGGTLTSPSWIIGVNSTSIGTNLHSAGTATLSTSSALSLGHMENASGVYRLSGSGVLELAGIAQIGTSGIGVFEQSGGAGAQGHLFVES